MFVPAVQGQACVSLTFILYRGQQQVLIIRALLSKLLFYPKSSPETHACFVLWRC